MPRFVDDPMKRVVDIYSAVDYLTSLPYVDAQRIGALGVCAGSGITVKASMTERRIKAVATVSAVDVGAATRKGWDVKALRPIYWLRSTRSPNNALLRLPGQRLST